MVKIRRCNSCGKAITNDKESTLFSCPSCQKFEIVRCAICRKTGRTYICKECGFEGP